MDDVGSRDETDVRGIFSTDDESDPEYDPFKFENDETGAVGTGDATNEEEREGKGEGPSRGGSGSSRSCRSSRSSKSRGGSGSHVGAFESTVPLGFMLQRAVTELTHQRDNGDDSAPSSCVVVRRGTRSSTAHAATDAQHQNLFEDIRRAAEEQSRGALPPDIPGLCLDVMLLCMGRRSHKRKTNMHGEHGGLFVGQGSGSGSSGGVTICGGIDKLPAGLGEEVLLLYCSAATLARAMCVCPGWIADIEKAVRKVAIVRQFPAVTLAAARREGRGVASVLRFTERVQATRQMWSTHEAGLPSLIATAARCVLRAHDTSGGDATITEAIVCGYILQSLNCVFLDVALAALRELVEDAVQTGAAGRLRSMPPDDVVCDVCHIWETVAQTGGELRLTSLEGLLYVAARRRTDKSVRQALLSLARLAAIPRNAATLARIGAIPVLLGYIAAGSRSSNSSQAPSASAEAAGLGSGESCPCVRQHHALYALLALSMDSGSAKLFMDAGGVPRLVGAARAATGSTVTGAAAQLAIQILLNLVRSSAHCRNAVVAAGGVKVVLDTFQGGSRLPYHQVASLKLLTMLAAIDGIKQVMVQDGALPILLDVVTLGVEGGGLRIACALLLTMVQEGTINCASLLTKGNTWVRSVVDVARSQHESPRDRETAALVLLELCKDDGLISMVAEHGGIKAILRAAADSTKYVLARTLALTLSSTPFAGVVYTLPMPTIAWLVEAGHLATENHS